MKIEDMKDGAAYLVRLSLEAGGLDAGLVVGKWEPGYEGGFFPAGWTEALGFEQIEVIRELPLNLLAAGAHIIPADAAMGEEYGMGIEAPRDKNTGSWVSLTLDRDWNERDKRSADALVLADMRETTGLRGLAAREQASNLSVTPVKDTSGGIGMEEAAFTVTETIKASLDEWACKVES